MKHQLDMPLDGSRSLVQSAWSRKLALAREAVAEIGLKEVAFDLDESKSGIEHALSERERHYFRAEWMLYLELRSGNAELAALGPSLRGLDCVPRKQMTAEEKCVRYERALAKLGEPVRAFVEGEVFGEDSDTKPFRRR